MCFLLIEFALPYTFEEMILLIALILQIDKFLKGPFTDRQGNFNYKEWIKVLRVNEDPAAGGAEMDS